MLIPMLSSFLVGLLAGLLAAWLIRKFFLTGAVTVPALSLGTPVCQSGGELTVNGTLGTAPAEAEPVDLHVEVLNDTSQTPGVSPGAGAQATGNTSFPFNHALPGGLTNAQNRLAVWAEYRVYVLDYIDYTKCQEASGESVPVARTKAVSAPAAGQLEAIPRAYRVSPGSPRAGEDGGPAAELIGSLAGAPENVLQYVPEASSPGEPFWRARGGPGPALEWTLCLLHGSGRFGAVLTVAGHVAGREVRLSWVTSDWHFDKANRLACESDDAGAPALLVSPA